jgi:hypothetical protein
VEGGVLGAAKRVLGVLELDAEILTQIAVNQDLLLGLRFYK